MATEISPEMRDKLALFCDIDANAVIQNKNAASIYQVPLMMQEEGLDRIVWLDGGRIVEEGSPAELMAHQDSRFARWIDSQRTEVDA